MIIHWNRTLLPEEANQRPWWNEVHVCCFSIIVMNQTEPNARSAESIMSRFQFKAILVQVLGAPSRKVKLCIILHLSSGPSQSRIRQRFLECNSMRPLDLCHSDSTVTTRPPTRATPRLEAALFHRDPGNGACAKSQTNNWDLTATTRTNITPPPSAQFTRVWSLAWEVKNRSTLAVCNLSAVPLEIKVT